MTAGQFIKRVVLFLTGLAILAGGIGLFWWQMRTARRAGRERPRIEAVAVRTLRLAATVKRVMVEATGTVVPARKTTLNAQVAGRVIAVASELTPGTVVSAGTVLVRLEPDDYETIVAQVEAQVADARHALRIEEGQQIVARRDWEAMPESVRKRADRDLVLRKPHLERARARLKAAEAALARARRDLARTEVRAPYNCVVVAKRVDVGQQVSPQTPLAEVVGTDEYWIEAALPVADLRWLRMPDPRGTGGSAAVVERVCGAEALPVAEGKVVRLLPDVTPDGRMARVLISVPHPRDASGSDGRAPLLLGDYVRARLVGRELRNIIALPRDVVHEGDQVWVYGNDGRLEIRHIRPVWHTRDEVWVAARSPAEAAGGQGLAPGEEIVASPIPAAVPGMRLRRVTAVGRRRAGSVGGGGARRPPAGGARGVGAVRKSDQRLAAPGGVGAGGKRRADPGGARVPATVRKDARERK